MSELTVIIPYLAGTPTDYLEETLASILEFRPEGLEILVVNAGRYSDSYSIEEEGVRFLDADEELGEAECVNIGIFAATTPIVQTLLCGVSVEEGWTDAALGRFESEKIGAVIPAVIEQRDKTGEIRRFGWTYRRDGRIDAISAPGVFSKGICMAPTRYGAFFRRQPLVDFGGFESFPLDFAGIDAVLLLDGLGFGTVCEPASRLFLDGAAAADPDILELLTFQEAIFRRWTDWRGRGKNLRLYRKRTFFAWLGGIFSARGKLLREGRAAGRTLGDENARKRKLLDAKRALSARRKQAAQAQ